MVRVVEPRLHCEKAAFHQVALPLLADGRQDVEVGKQHVVAIEEIERRIEAGRRLGIGAEDEAGNHLHAVLAHPSHRFVVIERDVVVLLVRAQHVDARALEADEDVVEAGFAHQAQRVLVFRDVDGELRAERRIEVRIFLVQLDDGAADLLEFFRVAEDVVVDEEDGTPRNPAQQIVLINTLELGDDRFGFLVPHRVAEHHDDGAELAVEGAPAAGLQRERHVAHPSAPIGPRQMRQLAHVGFFRLLVHRLQLAVARVVQHLFPHVLGLARADRIGVVQRVVAYHVRVVAAHHHFHAALAEAVGNLACAGGVGHHHRHGDEVVLAVEIDRVEIFVRDRQVDPIGRDGGDGFKAVEREPVAAQTERPQHQAVNLLLAELRAYLGIDVAARIDEQHAEFFGHLIQPSKRETSSTAFWPPNPNAFDMIIFNSASRAAPGT